MEIVPQMISSSDLFYIEDMFNRNYNAFKQVNSYISLIKQDEIKELLEDILDMHYRHLCYLMNCLNSDKEIRLNEE